MTIKMLNKLLQKDGGNKFLRNFRTFLHELHGMISKKTVTLIVTDAHTQSHKFL